MDMKRLIIFVFLFAIISFSITGVLINKANKNIDNIETNINNEFEIEEKTLDLNGLYNTNDLIIEYEENLDYKEFIKNFKIPQIKGLKDKSIEEKINKEMKDTLLQKIDKITQIENLDEYYKIENDEEYPIRIYYQEGCNFANVFSLTINIDYDVENDTNLEKVIFNYELVNGEKLKLEDLFVKNADIIAMLRKALYRILAGETSSYDARDNLYYDIEKNMWVTNGLIYDEETNDYIKGEKEYIPYNTEDGVNEKIKKYMQGDDKQFHFTETAVFFVIDKYDVHRLYFKDIADEVVIYDKYLTNESIFEEDGIGKENLLNCTVPRSNSLLQKYGLIVENMWYDLSIPNYFSQIEKYPFKENYNKLCKKAEEIGNQKLEEYVEIAKENPDKFYILSLIPTVSFKEVYRDDEKYNNIISINISESFETITLKEIAKEEIINDIISAYRYGNVLMYPSGLSCYYEGGWDNYEELRQVNCSEIIKNSATIGYDARNMQEIEDVKEIFVEGTDYNTILSDKVKQILKDRKNYSDDKINEILKEVTYDVSAFGIAVNIPIEYYEYMMEISFSEIDENVLNIYDFEIE